MTIDETCSCGARFQLTISDINRIAGANAAQDWRKCHQHTPPPAPEPAAVTPLRSDDAPLQDWERALLDAQALDAEGDG